MKSLLFILFLSACTKQLVIEPDNFSDKGIEKAKLEKTAVLGENNESRNKYNIIIINHEKNSTIEYAVPKNQEWVLPADLSPIACKTKGEELGSQKLFLMALSCSGVTQYELASIVACGVPRKFDAETLRILRDGRPYLTIQLRCSN